MRYPYRDPETGKFARAVVRNLPKDVQYISNDLECEFMQQVTNTNYDQFFVIMGDGEFLAAWGMFGVVPTLTKPVYRIF